MQNTTKNYIKDYFNSSNYQKLFITARNENICNAYEDYSKLIDKLVLLLSFDEINDIENIIGSYLNETELLSFNLGFEYAAQMIEFVNKGGAVNV